MFSYSSCLCRQRKKGPRGIVLGAGDVSGTVVFITPNDSRVADGYRASLTRRDEDTSCYPTVYPSPWKEVTGGEKTLKSKNKMSALQLPYSSCLSEPRKRGFHRHRTRGRRGERDRGVHYP